MRDPIDNPDEQMAQVVVEEIAIQTLSAFRTMLVDRIIEDIRYEMKYNYSPPSEWDDWYADHKDDIYEAVYDEVYDRLTYKLNEV